MTIVMQETVNGNSGLVAKMVQLSWHCGKRHFQREEELFLSIYTVFLFKGRNLAALTWKQGIQVNRLWEQYCQAK